jgi:hypothetical protein
VFVHSLWHGPAPNRSGSARGRKTTLYNYCQLFARCYDFELTPQLAADCTARQRRLLGDLGHEFQLGSYFYAPRDQVEMITGHNAGDSLFADTRDDTLQRA